MIRNTVLALVAGAALLAAAAPASAGYYGYGHGYRSHYAPSYSYGYKSYGYKSYDYVVVNDALEPTVVRLQEIIAAERSRTHRMTAIAETTLGNITAFAANGRPLHPVSTEKLA